MALRARAEALVQDAARAASPYVQVAFDAAGAVKLVKASGLVEREAQFHDIATRDALVDVVETLIGAGSRRFRDVLIVKPARTGGVFSYHQDSAYWDVEPKALVSCWIGLGDVPAEASCLSVVPATHTKYPRTRTVPARPLQGAPADYPCAAAPRLHVGHRRQPGRDGRQLARLEGQAVDSRRYYEVHARCCTTCRISGSRSKR